MRTIIFGATVMSMLAACAQKADGPAEFARDACRRVSVVDATTNVAIVGAEDLAYDAARGRIIFSAYDRRAAERAARVNRGPLPQGGLYAATLSALEGDVVSVEPLIDGRILKFGLRPHGLAFDAATGSIAFVNRAYERRDSKWRLAPEIVRIDGDGAVRSASTPAHCAANDLAMLAGALFVSHDHAACGWRGGLENVLGSRESGISGVEGANVFSGVRHANGVVATPDGRLALAATRDKAIFLLKEGEGAFSVEKKIELSGGPDNLTLSVGDEIIAAVHPSLLAIGLQRRLGVGKAGSRIVAVDPASGKTRLLFDDPRGALFQAATAAVLADGVLVAGSVVDDGLLVCRRASS